MSKPQNIYAPFRRLQDFPLDPSCVFETLEAAENYIANNKSAYKGQVISVHSDGENNGLYNIIVGSADNITLQKTINEDEFNKVAELVNVLNAKSDDFESRISKIEGGFQDDLAQLEAKIDKIINNDVTETIDSIKEFTDWINTHEVEYQTIMDLLTTYATKDYVEELISKSNGERLISYTFTGEVDEDIATLDDPGVVSEIKVYSLTDGSSLSSLVLSDSNNNEYFTLEDINTNPGDINILSLYYSLASGDSLHLTASGSKTFSAKIVVKLL